MGAIIVGILFGLNIGFAVFSPTPITIACCAITGAMFLINLLLLKK